MIPSESCNGIDDDCNGTIDDISGGPYCGDGCCNGEEDSCTCSSDCGLPPPPSPPSMLWPHNGQRLMTRRPLFKWFSSSGECGEPHYSIQVDDSCTTPGFSSCTFPEPEINESELSNESFLPSIELPVRTSPPVGKRYYWRVRACYGLSCSLWSEVWYVNVGMAETDFDGDGYGDLAVGASWVSLDNNRYGGVVYVYYGSIEGLQIEPSTILTNPSGRLGTWFGHDIVKCDANGDGYTDLLITTSPGMGYPTVYFYSGGPLGLSSENFMQMQISGSHDFLSPDISCNGDLNRDGFDDIIIGEPLWSGIFEDEGRVDVYEGGTEGPVGEPSLILRSPEPQEGEVFGKTITILRDMNADGYGDLIVASPNFDGSYENEGIIRVYLGNSSGIELLPSIAIRNPDPTEQSYFGLDIASAGDINGDGLDDFVAGVSMANMRAEDDRAYVFYGAPGIPPLQESFTTIYSPPEDLDDIDNFGGFVGSMCDLNIDGYDDICIDTTYSGIDSLIIYTGSPTGVSTSPFMILSSPEVQPYQRGGEFGCGSRGGCIGDINRDGNYDIAVGAPTISVEGCLTGVSNQTVGKVFIYYSDGHTIPTQPTTTLVTPCHNLFYAGDFGSALSTR